MEPELTKQVCRAGEGGLKQYIREHRAGSPLYNGKVDSTLTLQCNLVRKLLGTKQLTFFRASSFKSIIKYLFEL